MRRSCALLLAVAALALAGCLTGGVPNADADGPSTSEGPDEATPSGTSSEATSAATPDATTTDANVDAGIDTLDWPPESATVRYENLTAVQQSAFRDALDGGAVFIPRNTSYVNATHEYLAEHDEPFHDNEFVRYDGSLYRLNVSWGPMFSMYDVRTEAATPPDDADVTPFADLPESVRDETRTAVVNGSYLSPPYKWGSAPEPLVETEYLRYENRTYRLVVGVADGGARIVDAEKYE